MCSYSRFSFSVILFISICFFFSEGNDDKVLPKVLLCANSQCSEPISKGIAQLNYYADVKHKISVKRGDKVNIYSKDGENKDLWNIEVNGKRGFIPKAILLEKVTLVENKKLVPVKLSETSLLNNNRVVEEILKTETIVSPFLLPGSVAESVGNNELKGKINPNKVEVYDGTTLSNVDGLYETVDSTVPDTPAPSDSPPKEVVPESHKTEELKLNDTELSIDSTNYNSNSVDGSLIDNGHPGKLDEIQVSEQKRNDATTGGNLGLLVNPGEQESSKVVVESEVSEEDIDDEEEYDEDDDGDEPIEEDEEEDQDDKVEEVTEELQTADNKDVLVNDKVDVTSKIVSKVDTVNETPSNVLLENNTTVDGIESETGIPEADDKSFTNNVIKNLAKVINNVLVTQIDDAPEDISAKVLQDKPVEDDVSDESTLKIVPTSETVIVSDVGAGTTHGAESGSSNKVIDKSDLNSSGSSDSDKGSSNVAESTTTKGVESDSIKTNDNSDLGSSNLERTTTKDTKSESNSNITTHVNQLLTTYDNAMNNEVNKTESVGKSDLEEKVAEPTTSSKERNLEEGHKRFEEISPIHALVSEEEKVTSEAPIEVKEVTSEQDNINVGEIEKESVTPPSIFTTVFSGSGWQAPGEDHPVVTNENQPEAGPVDSVQIEPVVPPYVDSSTELPPVASIESTVDEQLLSQVPQVQIEPDTSSTMTPEEHLLTVDEQIDDSVGKETGYFSFDFSFLTNLFESKKEQPDQMAEEIVNIELSEKLPTESDNPLSPDKSKQIPSDQYCAVDGKDDGLCKQFDNLMHLDSTASDNEETDYWNPFKQLIDESPHLSVSTNSAVCLIITAVTVVFFSLGYYYIESRRHDGALVAKLNALERNFLVVKKEAAMLQDRLSTAESQVTSTSDNLSEFNQHIAALTEDIEELKAAKNELEEQYVILEKEFDAATESGLEMHRLLTESLSTQDGSQVLLKTVESLRVKLDHQDGEIKELKLLLGEKTEEVERLHEDIRNNQDTRKALQEKLNLLRREKEEELMKLKDTNGSLSSQLGDLMEEKSLAEMKLSNELSKLRLTLEETQTTLTDREGEIYSLKEAVSKLNKQEENLDSLYDTVKVTSRLMITEKEKDTYKEKFMEEEGARKLLEDHVRMTREEIKSLKENYEDAEKEKIEALTKLQVLSNYFKEKESQLQKELGSQESMWLQKQSDDHTIYEQMKSLREENDKYKLQNESLKKEICESESAFKIQLANSEQKAHDNWLSSRQLERRLKETQSEATQLRNRLTLVEKNVTNTSSDDLKQSFGSGETNGDPPSLAMFSPTTSPPFMMYGGVMPPPPSSEFLPPPPPLPMGFPEGRPAPVGRISSPPLDHGFSPPPPLPYFYDSTMYGGHHSPSPPPHRPMPKPLSEMGLQQKDRVSPPRYTDQQGRRGKR